VEATGGKDPGDSSPAPMGEITFSEAKNPIKGIGRPSGEAKKEEKAWSI